MHRTFKLAVTCLLLSMTVVTARAADQAAPSKPKAQKAVDKEKREGKAAAMAEAKQKMAAERAAKAAEAKKAAEARKAAQPKFAKDTDLPWPPTLPGGKLTVTDTSDDFIKPAANLQPGIAVAKTAPTVDFAFYPDQNAPGHPWSNWGDSIAIGNKYYASIGNHHAMGGSGFIYEYDPDTKTFRKLLDTKELLGLPEDHYMPGKIHSRIDMGKDGWLYCSTHRGSPSATIEANHYKGDWILRCNPATGKSEVVVQGPVGNYCIPNGTTDGERMIFYGGTQPGSNAADYHDGKGEKQEVHFFAYDLANKKLLYNEINGPARCMMLASSTGRVYFTPGQGNSPLMRFDPSEKNPKPVEIPGEIGIRAASRETPDHKIYTASSGQFNDVTMLYVFDTQTEKAKELAPAAVGTEQYVAAMAADPSGRYVYYVPGAHGGADRDGTPIVQFDTKTNTRKVLCFLHPFYAEKYNAALKGTYSLSCDPKDGSTLYITWNVSRGTKAWDCCALTAIHIPESERPL